jgi:Ca-activated chloride channel homolog
MIFSTPLGLLALLAIPAIVAIHLFRRRFPPRAISGLFLWQIGQQTPEGGGKISKLPITASLLLECLAALALALILAGARIRPAGVNEHLVVLLDDSASMSAVNNRGESARDRSVRRLLQEIDRLSSNSKVTLVLSGDRPSVLLGPAALAIEARTALEKWRPEAPHHALSLGLRLAREFAKASGRLMVLTDEPPVSAKEANAEKAVEGVVWVSVGESLPNIGITGAQRTISPLYGQGVVLLTLSNFSGSPSRRRLTLAAGGKELSAQDVDLPPGTSSLNLPLPPGLPGVKVSLSNDALRRDNEVILAEPRPQEIFAEIHLADGRGRRALSKALRAISGVSAAEHGHLAFVNATELDRPATPGLWRVGFGHPPSTLTAPGEPKDYKGPFVPEKRDALMEGVTLGGVVWTGAVPLAAGLHPLVSAGDQPLIALSGRRPENGILFNIDLDRTNLIRVPDWPILISNLVEMRRKSLPGPERWNYRIGEWIRARLDHEPKSTLKFRCGNIEHTLPAGRSIEFVAPEPGGLLQVMEGDGLLFDLGVNFLDENESNLQAKSAVEIGKFNHSAGGLRAESGPASDPLFWALLAIGGLAIIANWCLLVRVVKEKTPRIPRIITD